MRTDCLCHCEMVTVLCACFLRGKVDVRHDRKTDAQSQFLCVSVEVCVGVTFPNVLMKTKENPQASLLAFHHIFGGKVPHGSHG